MDILVDGELVLYGFVGDSYWDEGFTAKEVLDALAEVGRDSDITVRLNSGGGYVDDGKAIFNALKAHKGKVSVVVDGVAASSASIIAMAGAEIIMRTGALMMIHDPATWSIGTIEDHQKIIAYLEKEVSAFTSIYAERSGKTADECRALMKDETWFSAEEAVAAGFADKADSAKKAKAVASFDYSLYQHAPKTALALVKKNSWNFQEARAAASAGKTSQPSKEPDMTEAEKKQIADEAAAAATASATARIGDIINAEEAKGREALASHFAFKTTMSAADAKAALAAAPAAVAVVAPAAPEKKERQQGETEAAYAARKNAAGGDTVAGTEEAKTAKAEKVKAGWATAVKSANGSMGAA